MATCSAVLCQRPTHARGFCETHYSRWRLHGDAEYLRPHPDIYDRFMAKVTLTPTCWWWNGALTEGAWPYGKMVVGGRTIRAHRLAWYLFNGPIPDGMKVLHRCDNTRCVRIDHLFLGSLSDNSRDMVAKGRNGQTVHPEKTVRGSRHPGAKLTDAQVLEIRQRHAAGETNKAALARAYGVTDVLIGKIVRGESWAHLTATPPLP